MRNFTFRRPIYLSLALLGLLLVDWRFPGACAWSIALFLLLGGPNWLFDVYRRSNDGKNGSVSAGASLLDASGEKLPSGQVGVKDSKGEFVAPALDLPASPGAENRSLPT